MRVAMSWLREVVGLPAATTTREVATRLTGVGLEVEAIEPVGQGVSGPIVTGRVLEFDELTASNGKTVRWCQVDVGEPEPRGIICGARNFSVGDVVVVSLPGAVLPGGFAIVARKTYGHTSDGMICSARELGLGEEHSGILVLGDDRRPGEDLVGMLAAPDEILDIAVTPDRGYALSVRGVARETAAAFGLPFTDPAARLAPPAGPDGWPVEVQDAPGCPRFVARQVVGIDPGRRTPDWLAHRIRAAGMRTVGLVVDVTNYVMLELGQPLHAYDRARVVGTLQVRRARSGERLVTLDATARDLDVEDLVIADGSGPVGLAGVMGGARTAVGAGTTEVLVEAAVFDPVLVTRTARRHRLLSEASRRYERGVDPDLPPAAADRVVELLCAHGGGTRVPEVTDVDHRPARRTIEMALDSPGRVAGRAYAEQQVRAALEQVGCDIAGAGAGGIAVTVPSWRPDLCEVADLVEEVVRLFGLDSIPSVLPSAPAGRGLNPGQRWRRRVSRVLAATGYVEVINPPFVGPADWEALGVVVEDPRRRAVQVANPLSAERPILRTSLLPGLLETARRNVGRGNADLALFEMGRVFLPRAGQPPSAGRPATDRRPSDADLARIEAALPEQPYRVAVVASGAFQARSWWSPGQPVTWADAVEAAQVTAAELGVELSVTAGRLAPWHPGRTAVLSAGGQDVGHAGELHPAVVARLGLPERSVAMEIDLDALVRLAHPVVAAPVVSTFPPASVDVALVVADTVPANQVAAALRTGAGDLLESLWLFDVYQGEQVPAGHRSLAWSLRLRAADRTLTAVEAAAVRDTALACAYEATGAVLRG
ncbi:MAG: phenylalanine--tRNA ligase subunit beta [Actinomycetes bacterium]